MAEDSHEYGDGIAVGDWVTVSIERGYWRVYRVLKGMYADRLSPAAPMSRSSQVLIFAKRLWASSSSQRPALRVGCFDSSLVRKISNSAPMKNALQADEKLRGRFEKFPEDIDSIVNLTMNVSDRQSLLSFCESFSEEISRGLTLAQIYERLGAAKFLDRIGKFPINATLQLVCRDHEMMNDEFVFRTARVLNF